MGVLIHCNKLVDFTLCFKIEIAESINGFAICVKGDSDKIIIMTGVQAVIPIKTWYCSSLLLFSSFSLRAQWKSLVLAKPTYPISGCDRGLFRNIVFIGFLLISLISTHCVFNRCSFFPRQLCYLIVIYSVIIRKKEPLRSSLRPPELNPSVNQPFHSTNATTIIDCYNT